MCLSRIQSEARSTAQGKYDTAATGESPALARTASAEPLLAEASVHSATVMMMGKHKSPESCERQPPPVTRGACGPLVPVILVAAGCLHGVLQEQLVHEGSAGPLTVTSFEFGCCSVLSLIFLLLRGEDPTNVPLGSLLRISVLVLSSLVCGNVALKWVSYPIKVVVKSCKLLPTMALGSLLLRKRYSMNDQVAAVLLCTGLIGFTLAEKGSSGGRASSPLGVGLLLLAVSCDAVQVLLSERMLKQAPHLTPMHVMLYTNGFAFVAVAAMLAFSDDRGLAVAIPSAAEALQTLPWGRLMLYGASSWVGVCCFVTLTRSFGATAAVVATNARKLLTVTLSFLLFPKPFTAAYALSGAAVVAGVTLHARARKRSHAPAKAAKAA